jgi:hypothetical protein
MAPIEAYPLAWPDGWPRRQPGSRKTSDYKVTFLRARDELARELKAGRCRDVVISTNVPLRRDGLPLANMSEPKDPGVAVYWTGTDKHGKPAPRVIACDVWRTVRENLRAVGLAYASLRQIERTGASELLERAFSGFARLPAAPDCWQVLGLPPGCPRTTITDRYRDLARAHHPDRGGDPALMAAINAAYQQATASAGARA